MRKSYIQTHKHIIHEIGSDINTQAIYVYLTETKKTENKNSLLQ